VAVTLKTANDPVTKLPTTMLASFTPSSGSLAGYAEACGFTEFDWQQTITVLPLPSDIYRMSDLTTPLTAGPGQTGNAPPFYDPVSGGYSYNVTCPNGTISTAYRSAFPFYFAVNGSATDCGTLLANETTATGAQCPALNSPTCTTLSFDDTPHDPCIFGGPNAFTAACNFEAPLNPAFMGFTTALVGVYEDGTASAPLYQWTWQDNNNSSETQKGFGGIYGITVTGTQISNPNPLVPGSGTGGATITSINGVQLPPVVPPNQVATTASGLAYSRVSQTFNGTVTVKNISGSAISGPLQIVFFGMPANVTLVNATGNLSGTPYLTVPAVTSLAPGQSVTVSVQFKNPANAAINITPAIYSGSIN